MQRFRSLLAATAGGLPSRFWWIWAGVVVSALATFVFLFLAVYLTARGFDPRRVGLIVSCFGVGSLAAGPIGGTLADRAGRRPTLVGALVASAALARCGGTALAGAGARVLFGGCLAVCVAVAAAHVALGSARRAREAVPRLEPERPGR